MSQASKPRRQSARKQAEIARTQRERRRLIIISGGAVAVLIVAILVYVNRPTASNVPTIDFASIPSNGMVLGNPDATVRMVEFADYQCPFCAKFGTEVFPQLAKDFIETGLITYEFHVFPFLGGEDLSAPNNESVKAAEAAMCALDQGKFWEYNHMLFERHNGENQGTFSTGNLKKFAKDLGLDTDTFNTCLDSGQHHQEVLDQHAAAKAAGVNSTPTFFINGQSIPYTSQGYALLKRQIEAAIAGKPIPFS